MEKLLKRIQGPNDIKNIPPEEYRKLAKEIRVRLVRSVSRTGGHLASNLGAVELTMALHLFLDFPKDKLIWDVGHQAYVHKILTGRNSRFGSLRQKDGISGFPRTNESEVDLFNTGHSSTSISTALGLAKARDIKGTDEKIVAVIGDGALTSGLAFEALNNAEPLKSNLMIVINDNRMSIAKNVGGMSTYLGKLRTNRKYNNLKVNIEELLDRIPSVGTSMSGTIKNAKNSLKHLFVPGMLFEEMGIIYMGPIDGHDINQMTQAFQDASRIKNRPVIVHVITKKGKGYGPAEKNPSVFHGIGRFDIRSGKSIEKKTRTYTDVFSDWLVKKGREREDLVSICAAMPDGTGTTRFSKVFPKRFFDVGIAEEHAVTFSAGIAKGGLRPVVSIYSTFFQRAYDEILHDVALNNLPVVFAVDRSGIVGRDGDTHQGVFDISYFSSIPNITIISPMDETELEMALDYAIELGTPVAVRYPRGTAVKLREGDYKPMEIGKSDVVMIDGEIADSEKLERVCEENQISGSNKRDVLILAVGNMVENAMKTSKRLQKEGVTTTVVNMRFVKPYDTELVLKYAPKHRMVVTIEDNEKIGGFGQQVLSFLEEKSVAVERAINYSFDDFFVEHGAPRELYEKYGFDDRSMSRVISLCISKMKKMSGDK
ncbi:1-deoxy-D-xylulose-5-phosphate synthase [Eubacterium xylanophilum]|uniref:1-deoxy-D-xylulose-5-phosphate synthase n=1 Tax=Eubacterium xylanophilum TaxID=39497 RepID=UPI000478A248|nr:1-deoxy-D-xylulose-5-phosphate synthase [Eubacterium xylanophilum]